MTLTFSDYKGGNAPAPGPSAPAQKGGRRRRTSKRSSKKWFVWKGGDEGQEGAMEEEMRPEGEVGGRRRRRNKKSCRKSRKSRKSKKFFGLFN
jgi:hypothetical protein|uniref:Uncharacterized protein n=1 Tax=viral metagenome TaxID=1070528 RepID=A0A6C0ASX2_9ZZZZ